MDNIKQKVLELNEKRTTVVPRFILAGAVPIQKTHSGLYLEPYCKTNRNSRIDPKGKKFLEAATLKFKPSYHTYGKEPAAKI